MYPSHYATTGHGVSVCLAALQDMYGVPDSVTALLIADLYMQKIELL